MSFFDVLKGVLAIAVDVGTGLLVGHYAGAAVSSAKGIQKICAGVAATAIGGYVGSKATEWVNNQVDNIENSINLNNSKELKEELANE